MKIEFERAAPWLVTLLIASAVICVITAIVFDQKFTYAYAAGCVNSGGTVVQLNQSKVCVKYNLEFVPSSLVW